MNNNEADSKPRRCEVYKIKNPRCRSVVAIAGAQHLIIKN